MQVLSYVAPCLAHPAKLREVLQSLFAGGSAEVTEHALGHEACGFATPSVVLRDNIAAARTQK